MAIEVNQLSADQVADAISADIRRQGPALQTGVEGSTVSAAEGGGNQIRFDRDTTTEAVSDTEPATRQETTSFVEQAGLAKTPTRVETTETTHAAVSPTMPATPVTPTAPTAPTEQQRVPVVPVEDVMSTLFTDEESTLDAVDTNPELVEMPETGFFPNESRRARTESFADVLTRGDRLANLAQTRVQAAEAQRTAAQESGEPYRRNRSRRTSVAERAIRATEEAYDAAGQERPWWTHPVDRIVRFSQNADLRTKKFIDKAKSEAARAFKRSDVGNRVYGKMIGTPNLGFQEIGLGLEEILAAQSQNTDMLEKLLHEYLGEEIPPVATMKLSDLADLINNNDIWVATFKPPNNQGPDIQRRKLRIMTNQARGIFLHSYMSAMYTADYDGDDMEVSFDPDVAKYAKDPMEHMVDIYGKTLLNSDFMPVAQIFGKDGMSEEDYVRDYILQDVLAVNQSIVEGQDKIGRDIHRHRLAYVAPLVNAILDLANGNTDPATGYANVFREARRFADHLTSDRTESNRYTSDILERVVDDMQRRSYNQSLSATDGDVLLLDTEMVPKPVTRSDAAVYKVIDGIIKGRVPNNFQEIKLLLNGFVGNVKGKNAPFRFTADVGKMIKMDERLMVGNGFVLDPENDEDMELFFQTTLKFAGSLKMAKEIKKAGHSEFYTQVLRQRVMEEVGFPQSYRNVNGDVDFSAFLEAFAKSYAHHSVVVNQANMVFLTNMGLSTEDGNVVSELKKSDIVRHEDGSTTYRWTLSDLADPFLSVYGTFSVDRMFRELSSVYMTAHERDPYAAENPDAYRREKSIEREYDHAYDKHFWITGRYLGMSLRQFKNENHLIYGQQDISTIRAKTIDDIKHNYRNGGPSSTINAEFDLLMAIADKRTGAASKYNQYTFGDMEREHKFNEKSVIRQMSTLLMSVNNAMREGHKEIAPGYYAGIGQREFATPELESAVASHMTNVAKRLANMGGVYGSWVLRSGDAKGSDQAFQLGAGRAANIYKSSSGYGVSKVAKDSGCFVTSLDKMSGEDQRAAYAAVERLHDNPDKLDETARNLIARNYFQVVGTDGIQDSAFVACYADGTSHGTWQAIKIARERGIPVFNMAEYEDFQQWEEDVIDAATKAYSHQLYTSEVGHDQILEIDEALGALRMANPDMFAYYNMDSTSAFLESAYGRKMLQYADNLEVLGGIYTTMVFEYRMDRINSLSDDLLSLDDTNRLSETWDELLLAKDELASASSVWNGIIREFEAESSDNEKSFFQMIHSNEGVMQKADDVLESGKRYSYEWSKNVTYEAAKFWVGSAGSHPTLMSVINDLDMDRTTKWNVITDVVRYWNKDGYIKSYEVGYQLEVASDSSYAIGGAPGRSVLGVSRDFNDAFNRWSKRSQTRLRNDVDRARTDFSNRSGALITTLQRLDAEPWELVSIDSEMYADSILAVYDKTYAQTEKAKQNPWTNAIYAALSYQKVGGYMNDITRTDDRLLGLTSIDSVSIQDVIHLLADPTASLTVYDRYGRYAIINRNILLTNELGSLSDDIEADMWEFLSREPRIASAIRKHTACVQADGDGTGYLGASNSIHETIQQMLNSDTNELDHVRYLMRDQPGYAAIIALALPGSKLSTRTARKRIARLEEYLSQQIYIAASGWEAEDAAPIILSDLGITSENLREIMRSDYDKYLERLDLDAYKFVEGDDRRLESDNDADEIYGYALKWLTGYIDQVKKSGMTLGNRYDEPVLDFDKPVLSGSSNGIGFTGVGPDAVSAAAFWDVVQELSGAKTAVSTGIEGSETYRFAEWASHVKTQDRYASIQALGESGEINNRWNGMWTNLTNSDGSPVFLSVDNRGVSVTMTIVDKYGHEVTNTYYMNPAGMDLSFENAKDDGGIDEIVVEVPEGWVVRDRSTDTHGNQVASLFAYMVSKRINGAETFNLKAKKSGIDGKDSITKMLKGGKHKPGVSYQGLVSLFSDIAANQGIRAARLRLAQMMLKENKEIGYDDLTLANYMSIAELMLIQQQDEQGNPSGPVCLRSLEMLFTAMKYRIGFGVDDMSDKQLTNAVNEILNDLSENGVGIAQMNSLDALDGFKPRSRSMQHNAIRQSSSIFQRNFNLMDEISRNALDKGIEPLSATEVDEIDKRLVNRIKDMYDEKTAKKITGLFGAYKIVSILDDSGADNPDYRTTIGPANAMYVSLGRGENSAELANRAYRDAYDNGMTIILDFMSYSSFPEEAQKSAIPMDDEGYLYMIPCFDMRLNGYEASPYHAQFAIAPVDYSSYVVSVEDSINEFMLGDAAVQPLTNLTKRMSVKDSNSVQITAEDLFPNVLKNKEYKDWSKRIGFAKGETVQNLIVAGLACSIDYGMIEGGRGWEQRVKDVNDAIDRYRDRWEECDDTGLLMGMSECKPGDIVGWVEMELLSPEGERQYVLAPIIPFPLHGVKRQPSTFSVQNLGPVSGDATVMAVDWSNESSLENNYIKYFDSSGGANKGMMSLSSAIDEARTLLDGTPIDAYIAKASTDSRKVGTDRRIKTMISLMAMARMHGYNFARKSDGTINDAAFPDNPELREELYHDRIPRDRWRSILDSNVAFVVDKRLNAFIRYECEKVLANGGNPSDYLGNLYTDNDGNVRDTHMMWEFEAMFEQGINYEDSLLRFLAFVNPVDPNNENVQQFCPNGIDDVESKNTLFRLYQENGKPAEGYDRGVLQMRVPHKTGNGMAYVWDNVYVGLSFFGEDYSGFTRPNVDGASIFLDGMNTMSMYGVTLKGKWERDRAKWATADIARHPHSNGSFEKFREV